MNNKRKALLCVLVCAVYKSLTQVNRANNGRSLSIENNQDTKPIQYPFFICQFGRSRSGTTFQTELIKAIMNLKSPPGINIDGSMRFAPSYDPESGQPYGLWKSHREKDAQECVEKGFPLFTSGMAVPEELKSNLHHQSMEDLEECSLCEVEKYQQIFDLSDEEVSAVKDFMKNYQILRKCCGLQMSQFNRLRLHGCDITPFKSNPHYPHCETHNMTEIELKFDSSPIYFQAIRPDYNWAQPGDCAKFDEMIISDYDFNGKSFTGICRQRTFTTRKN